MSEAIRFHVDEHIGQIVVRGLRRRGIDATTATNANLLSSTDEEHLSYAARNGRVLVTQDRDFLRLHAEGRLHAGIAFFPQGRRSNEILQNLLLLHGVLAPQEMVGRVEFF